MNTPKRYRIGFLMDQVAGHVTNYRNLRAAVDADPDVDAHWVEVHYFREGGRLERLGRSPVIPTYLTGNTRGTVELRRGLRSGPFDALFSNAAVSVFATDAFRRTPTIYDYDSTPVQLDGMAEYTPRPDPRPIAKVKFALTKRLLTNVTLNQAWSHWAKRSAVEDYGVPSERVVVNPPGVDLDRWKLLDRKDRNGGGPRRVLFVGNNFRRKGGELLVAWHASRAPDDVELHIVSSEADHVSGPNIFVHRGVEPNSDRLTALYRDADLFVLPSLAECFGIATIEAMATGLPVVTSDSGGTADIVEVGGNGLIVPANDGRALGDALDSLLADPGRRASFGARSRLIAETNFDVHRNGARTLALLKDLADRNQPWAVDRSA